RFSGASVLRGGSVATHRHHRVRRSGAGERALNEAADGAVFHRYVAAGSDEVCLLYPYAAQRVVVVGIAEIGPYELRFADALRQDLPDGERILNLLEYKAREDREDLQGDAVAELVAAGDERRIHKAIPLALCA